VRETHHGQHESIAGRLDAGDVFPLAKHDGADADSASILQRIAEQSVRFDASLAVRLEVVRLVEVKIRDLVGWHKSPNVECLRSRDAGLLKVLVGHDDALALCVLVAFNDVTPRYFDAFLAAEPLVLDPGVVLPVQQVERQRFATLDR
jgi:hypothetical protein